MRNTGWYVPYWRKSRKKGKPEREPQGLGKEKNGQGETSEIVNGVYRSDEQLDVVRKRWIERYRKTLQALHVFALSVGSNRIDLQTSYDELKAQGRLTREGEEAYRYLLRVLPGAERRRRRPVRTESSGQVRAGRSPQRRDNDERRPPVRPVPSAAIVVTTEIVVQEIVVYDVSWNGDDGVSGEDE